MEKRMPISPISLSPGRATRLVGVNSLYNWREGKMPGHFLGKGLKSSHCLNRCLGYICTKE